MTQTTAHGPRLSADAGRSQDAVAGVQQIMKSIYAGGVPRQTLELVHMRASQINGCNACIAAGITTAQSAGMDTDRLIALPAWRESALFDDAERGALALTEAMTRLADHPDVVTDEIWAQAAEHFDESGLSALVSMIALTNFFNRVNTALRVQPGAWG
ncbi:MAG TPA: carboxymuconolactone decarboxylase family protein [Solirubrobacteraceae bacterium]|jgi:AhpD family alkylhydroperoxidase